MSIIILIQVADLDVDSLTKRPLHLGTAHEIAPSNNAMEDIIVIGPTHHHPYR